MDITYVQEGMVFYTLNWGDEGDQPRDPAFGLFGRGRIHMALNQVNEALSDFRELMQYNARDFLAAIDLLLNNGHEEAYLYLLRGLIHADEGDWDASVADYIHGHSAGADRELINYFLVERSRLSASQGNIEKAISDLQPVIELETDNTDLLLELGSLYMDSSDPQKAAASFDDLLQLQPDNIDAQIFRGYAQAKQGYHKEAAADLCSSLEMMIDRYAAGETMGSLYFSEDDLMTSLSKQKINCYPSESEVAGLPDWPSDLALPEDFIAYPVSIRGIAPDDWATSAEIYGRPVTMFIEDSFWFTTVDGNQNVFGYTMDLSTADGLALFDQGLDAHPIPDFDPRFADSDDFVISSISEFELGDEIGDRSFAGKALFFALGQNFKRELNFFRIGETGVLLVQNYPAAEVPPIDLLQTGHLLAEKLGG